MYRGALQEGRLKRPHEVWLRGVSQGGWYLNKNASQTKKDSVFCVGVSNDPEITKWFTDAALFCFCSEDTLF